MAEKIVEGLLLRTSIISIDKKTNTLTFRGSHEAVEQELAKEISRAIYDNLTYGNLGTLTMRDNKGRITAKLYILPDGTLADDSWTCNLGWMSKKEEPKKGCEVCEKELKERS